MSEVTGGMSAHWGVSEKLPGVYLVQGGVALVPGDQYLVPGGTHTVQGCILVTGDVTCVSWGVHFDHPGGKHLVQIR